MIPRLLLPALLTLLLAGPVLAGTLTPAMEDYLSARSGDEPLSALVLLKDRVDIKALDWQLHEARTPRAERHHTVVTTLQAQAQATQGALLADLEIRRQRGEIDDYESFWIVNGVVITGGDEAMIRDLAARHDVDVIEPPLEIELIEPVSRGEPDKSTLGIGITNGVVNVGARRVWSDLGINGTGALVANVDTGVHGSHSALASRWRGLHTTPAESWLDLSSGTSFPWDGDSHGTHTMGTICGLAPDDTIGVAPGAQWIAANSIIGGNLNSKVLTTMQWLADPDGNPNTVHDVPDVTNHSWGVTPAFGYPDCYSGWWEAIDASEAAGVVHVWATGNEGPSAGTVRSPGDRATTIYDSFSVGSTNPWPPFAINGFSSRGPAGPNCGPEENRIKPEVVAPGNSIYSSVPGGYTYMSGTSMATPHVAGVIALMRSANPDLDNITIKQILMDTAIDLGTPGEDNAYGHGFLDAYAAVSAAMTGYGQVAGTVVDAGTSLPIIGAVIEVDGSQYRTTTDEDGAFRLTLPAGPAMLMLSAFGYENRTADLDVEAGEELTPVLEMTALPLIVLQGTAFGPDGAPADGVLIQVTDTPLPLISSGADGAWSVSAPQGDQYTLRASLSGQGACVQTLPADRDRHCNLYLRASPEDGFESGSFDAFAWSSSGNADWDVTDADTYEGQFSARSGAIWANETSILRLDIELEEDGELSFWFKTQGGGGSLAFWDGFETIETWSGVSAWTHFTYPVQAGAKVFRWRYATTSNGGSGDHGLIDLVVLPGGDAPAPRAVPCPEAVTAEASAGGLAEAELLVLNQGVEPLDWSLATTASWLSLDETSGLLDPAGFALVTLSFDATGLVDGLYTTDLLLTSNDPQHPSLVVPVQLLVGGVTSAGDTPDAFALVGAVPNPFNPQTTIHFRLPADQSVRLDLYDVQGRLVRQLVDGVRPAGANEAQWDGRDQQGRAVASGTYFARLQSGSASSVKSMVLVR
jgi:subtilisin family serine protease